MTKKYTMSSAPFDVEKVIRDASLSEKVALLAGKDFWHTMPLERHGVPSVRLSDGPNGVRGTKFFKGVQAACLPCGTGLAATWDAELMYKAGVLIGEECRAKGAHCWLGPTVNIARSPLGGRGFESLSEDPYLSGKLAGAYINGTQSTGVIATIKHFVANDQEHERLAVNVQVNDRALREIYLLPFQIAIADSQPGAVMTAYNKVNGTHVSESKDFLETILREEWGWEGLIMSDWFGTYSTSQALNAGLDLEMPGPTRWRGVIADTAVSSRKVTPKTIDERARNMLKFVQRASAVSVAAEEGGRDLPEDRQLNRQLAADSIVLLKNDCGVLPLRKDVDKIALIGPNLKNVAFCGGGSAALEPYYTVSPFEAIVSNLGQDTKVSYTVGAHAHAFVPMLGLSDWQTPEGQPGARMRFYRDPPACVNRDIASEVVIHESFWHLMGFKHPLLDDLFFATVEADFSPSATGAFEFGMAVYGTASLYIQDEIVIDNTKTQVGGHFFFGKGTREEKATVNLVEGRSYRLRVEYASAPSSKIFKPGVVNFGGGACRLGMVQQIDKDSAIEEAVRLARENPVTILCAGLSRDWESEGYDRADMDLPGAVSELISAVVAANPKTVVVTQSGTPINMLPWADGTSTLVHSWYGGNETGNGIADVLFGNVNPAGRLPLSFPRKIQDVPSFLNFGSERGRVVYGESIYVGYRFFEKVERDVLFPFGHGLSFTGFVMSDLEVSPEEVTLQVKNVGPLPGAEVVQVYVAADPKQSSIARPKKELKGFAKIFLRVGESRVVRVPLDRFATTFWDEVLHEWVAEKGVYSVQVGRSSADIVLEGRFEVEETMTWSGL